MRSTKRIAEGRDRWQSKALVVVAGTLLAMFGLYVLLISGALLDHEFSVLSDVALSLTFGLVAWVLRAATLGAAGWGSLICLLILVATGDGVRAPVRSGLAPLVALVVLTFVATRMGRRRKAVRGLAEARRGRNGAQVIANLGMAGLVAACGFAGVFDRVGPEGQAQWYFSTFAMPLLLLAALCESAADTVSSEIGQAFGGTPVLLTTGRRMREGTNGAITPLGTLAGMVAAGVVAVAGMWGMRMGYKQTLAALCAGVAGLFFDSLLGATVERKGWLGNDLVNFAATVFAVGVGMVLVFALGKA